MCGRETVTLQLVRRLLAGARIRTPKTIKIRRDLEALKRLEEVKTGPNEMTSWAAAMGAEHSKWRDRMRRRKTILVAVWSTWASYRLSQASGPGNQSEAAGGLGGGSAQGLGWGHDWAKTAKWGFETVR